MMGSPGRTPVDRPIELNNATKATKLKSSPAENEKGLEEEYDP